MSEKHGTHWLEREDFGDVTAVRFKTPKVMDEENSSVFNQIYTLITIGRNQLVVNLAVCTYLTSMGIGKLVMLNRKVQAAGGRLALCHLSANAKEVLETTRVLSLFAVFATEDAALKSFTTGTSAEPGASA